MFYFKINDDTETKFKNHILGKRVDPFKLIVHY